MVAYCSGRRMKKPRPMKQGFRGGGLESGYHYPLLIGVIAAVCHAEWPLDVAEVNWSTLGACQRTDGRPFLTCLPRAKRKTIF